MYRKNINQRKNSRGADLKKITLNFGNKLTKTDKVEETTKEAQPIVGQNPFLDSNKALPDISPEDDLMFVGIPGKIVKDASKIPTVDYHFTFTTRSLAIYVTEIHSPFKFWFMLADDNQQLSTLMKSIHQFYSEEGFSKETESVYKMNKSHAVEGRACAALYNYVWHRAVIVKPANPNDCKIGFVTVMYIDYGTIDTIPLESIRFLLKEFAELPRMIMRGRLALVTPKDNEVHWTRELDKDATETFFDFVYSKKLNATLYAYEEDEGIYHLVLHDAAISENHRMLSINQKLALTNQCKLLTRKIEEWPHVDEVYPTFEMLENNLFPTYAQLLESENPESYLSGEKTAPYYKDEYKRQKCQKRKVYGYYGDAWNESFIKEENKVKSGSFFDCPPTYDDCTSTKRPTKSLSASSILNRLTQPQTPKRQSASEYLYPAAISNAINRCKNLSESECKKTYREYLGVQHWFDGVLIEDPIPAKQSKAIPFLKKLDEMKKV